MDAVEEIRSRLSIEDVISEYVQLKRSGSNFKGMSPFTNEKTPSFMVSPQKQIWHDFSSGKGGNMFSFVMEMEGLDFKGALELLARKAGIDISQYRSGTSAQTGQLKEQLYRINELAAKFYQVQFSRGQSALAYVFKKRGFTKQVALDFRLGYSPNTGRALLGYLKKQGISDELAVKSGLVTKRYGSMSDMFRGRLMIPLMDQQGQVIGFTARLLEENIDAPKYINTPQTLLYDKSRHVFGLHLAKEAIRRQGFVVVAEGNLDVIASHQSGIKQVVATAGTAMTEQHLKTLSRFTPDIRLAFDQDEAGQAAAERTIPIASKLHLSLGIITIPQGKDPDELIRVSPEKWEGVIAKKQYAVDWLVDKYKQKIDLNAAEGKRQFSDKILSTVRRLQDPVEQEHYVEQLARLLSVSKDALRTKLRSSEAESPRLRKRVSNQPAVLSQEEIERHKVEDHLLSICLFDISLRGALEKITEDMLSRKESKALLHFIRTYPNFDGHIEQLDSSEARTQLQQFTDYVKIIRLQYETLYLELDELERTYEATRLQNRLIEQYVKVKKREITEQLHDADEIKIQALLETVRELDILRKN